MTILNPGSSGQRTVPGENLTGGGGGGLKILLRRNTSFEKLLHYGKKGNASPLPPLTNRSGKVSDNKMPPPDKKPREAMSRKGKGGEPVHIKTRNPTALSGRSACVRGFSPSVKGLPRRRRQTKQKDDYY